MEISEWSINGYLIFVIFSGFLSLLGGLFGDAPGSSLRLGSGAWSIFLGLCGLLLFSNGIVQDTWVSFMAVVTLSAVPYLPGMVKGLLDEARGDSEREREKTEIANWGKIRSRGKRRFVLSLVFFYGYGALWFAVPLKILFLDWFPIYLFVMVVVGFTVWGCIDGMMTWKRNEMRYISC